ncbi:MAG: hypothetical protein KDA91_22260, partial [Planctomycetaceae bacterium]|nr:hypothetical protein [Planctomycetaceae bacterium]
MSDFPVPPIAAAGNASPKLHSQLLHLRPETPRIEYWAVSSQANTPPSHGCDIQAYDNCEREAEFKLRL